MHQLFHEMISVNATSSHGQTLLHLCVDAETPVDTFYIIRICGSVVQKNYTETYINLL